MCAAQIASLLRLPHFHSPLNISCYLGTRRNDLSCKTLLNPHSLISFNTCTSSGLSLWGSGAAALQSKRLWWRCVKKRYMWEWNKNGVREPILRCAWCRPMNWLRVWIRQTLLKFSLVTSVLVMGKFIAPFIWGLLTNHNTFSLLVSQLQIHSIILNVTPRSLLCSILAFVVPNCYFVLNSYEKYKL